MVKASPSNAGGVSLTPGWGTMGPHALWLKKTQKPEAIL